MKVNDKERVQQQARAEKEKGEKAESEKTEDGKSFRELLQKKSEKKSKKKSEKKLEKKGAEGTAKKSPGDPAGEAGKDADSKLTKREGRTQRKPGKRAGEPAEGSRSKSAMMQKARGERKVEQKRAVTEQHRDVKAGAELRSDRRESDRQMTESGATEDASGKRRSVDEEMEFEMKDRADARAMDDGGRRAGEEAGRLQQAHKPGEVAEARAESAKAPRDVDPKTKERLSKLADEMVQKIQVGEDMQKRKVVFMELEVPGRGEVKIRLRRDGEGYDLRMRAKDPEFAESLRNNETTLRREASEKGLRFTGVEIVG